MIRLQSTYFAPPAYLRCCMESPGFRIEAKEHFEKQSYRNRTVILGPNGPQPLVVPVYGRNHKQRMDEVRISYTEPWLRTHINALQTAYRSAPYFEHLYWDIEPVLLEKPEKLIDLNAALLGLLLRKLRTKKELNFSASYALEDGETDGRSWFHPKKEPVHNEPYPQVFREKFGFVPGLGILDQMMNDLSGTAEYLKRLPR